MKKQFWSAAALTVALIASPVVAQEYENDAPEVPEHGSFKPLWGNSDDKDSGGSSGGGFFGRLLGGEEMEEFEGRYINTLKSRHIEPRDDVVADRSGIQLARREALGPHKVPVPLPSVTAYAQKVVERLLQGSAISGVVPEIHVVADPRIHGSAFPDGTILLTLGAIRNFRTEDQLAAILAHELAHIILRHHDSDWFMDSQQRGMAALEFALEMRQKIEKMRSRGRDDQGAEHLKMRFIAKGVVFASELLIDSPYTRVQEDQADLLAFDMLHAAGYSMRAMSALLGLVAQQEKKALEDAEKRQTDFSAALKDLGDTKNSGNFLTNLFEKSETLFDGLLENVKGELDSKHRDAQERRKSMRAYMKREYADEKSAKPTSKEWLALKSSPAVKAAITGYGHVYTARNSLTEGAYETAVDEIRKALEYLGPRHAAPRLTAALISAGAGIRDEAKFYFAQSLSADQPALKAYTGYAELLRQERNFDAAMGVLDRAKADFKDAPQLMPDYIMQARATRGAQKGPEALNLSGLIARCKLSPLKKLPKFCQRAQNGKYSNLTPMKVATRLPIGFKGGLVRVNRPTLNMRKGPGGKYATLGSLKRNATLSVLEKRNKWLLVRSDDGREGWVAGWLTQRVSTAASAPARKVQKPRPAAAQPRQVRQTPAKQPAPKQAAPKQADAAARLRKLKQLHDQGLVTDAEYAAKRKEILETL